MFATNAVRHVLGQRFKKVGSSERRTVAQESPPGRSIAPAEEEGEAISEGLMERSHFCIGAAPQVRSDCVEQRMAHFMRHGVGAGAGGGGFLVPLPSGKDSFVRSYDAFKSCP